MGEFDKTHFIDHKDCIHDSESDEMLTVTELLEEIHYASERLDGLAKMLLSLLNHLKEKNKKQDVK